MTDYYRIIADSGYNSMYYDSLGQFLSVLINFLMGISFILSIVSLGYAGILYSNSAGDPKNISKAHQALLWGGIALFITLASVAAKIVIFGILGTNEIIPDTPEF